MKMRYISLVLLLCVLFSGCAASSIGTASILEAASSLVAVDELAYSVARSYDDDAIGMNIYTEASGGGLSYHMKADGGSFDHRNDDLIECTISGGEMAGWIPTERDRINSLIPPEDRKEPKPGYIEVVIQEGENIVGYALITADDDQYGMWNMTLNKCVTFTDGNGDPVSVSAEEVQKRLEQARQELGI